MKKIYLIITLVFTTLNGASPYPVFSENGMVVSTSRQASETGVEIMKKGGNAVDAAVATGFVLAVTSSSNGNIGGGGFMVVRMADGTTFTLDYREIAPAAAHRDMYLDDNGDVIENMSLRTRAACGVPGTVDGLLKIWADHGSGNISRRELLAPAIALAEKGFELSHYEASRFNSYKELFSSNEAAAEVFIRHDGRPWKDGDKFVQKDLSKTLKQIARDGREGFYTGKTADLIVAEMNRGIGLITYEDLLNYKSKYREPVMGSFKDFDLISMGLPSSGGTILVEMFNMLENFPLAELGWNSSNYIHLLTEVERRAYADRAEHLGDSDYWQPPLFMLINKEYAKDRISDFSPDQATPSRNIFAGDPSVYESRETTHFSVVDKEGNAVSGTTTINLSYGGGFLVKGGGFFLNNEMDDFSAKPGVPNAFKPFIILGSPGGSTIITTVLQTILNVTVHNMDIQEAVSAPRIHSQWLPDVIMVEQYSIIKDVEESLKSKGHIIEPYKWTKIGEMNAILINENGYFGAADTRGENTAVGY